MLRASIFTFFAMLILSCNDGTSHKLTTFKNNSIVGGELTSEPKFNGVVAIVRSRDIICTGVAISKTVILTAAHCLAGQHSVSLSVYVGDGFKLPSQNRRDIVGQYKVASTYFYPSLDYDHNTGVMNLGQHNVNDIGVLILEQELENVKTYPILSHPEEILSKLEKGNEVTVVGYGYTGEDTGYKQDVTYGLKRKVNIPIVSFNHHEADIRAKGKDSCYVDSGAPAFVDVNGKLKILAVVSRADGLCGEAEFPVHYSLTYNSICWLSQFVDFKDDQQTEFHCFRNKKIQDTCFSLPTELEKIVCAEKISFKILKDQKDL